MILKRNEKAAVILPRFENAVERFAAEELIRYLKLSVGVCAGVSENICPDRCNFILGAPQRNDSCAGLISEAKFQKKLTGAEGFYLSVRENTAVIAGSEGYDDCRRGTLYGVYEFLERCLGCSFGAFCADCVNAGEVVPQREVVEIGDFCYIRPAADLSYRTAIVQYSNWAANADRKLNVPFVDWLGKNRYNRILTWTSIYEKYKEIGMLLELEKRGIRLSVGHHESAATWLPHFGNAYFAERYYETHPEFYRLQKDGGRFVPKSAADRSGQWIYCSRNAACIEEVSRNLIAWSKENPAVDIIAFWPNDDSDAQCCCGDCSKYSKVENYAYFQNEVAKRVSAERPHVKIDMLVYQDLWECPQKQEFCDAVVADESTWTPQGLRSGGKPDGSCLIETDCDRNLLQWKKKCKNVVYYDYYMGVYSNKQRIIPMADEIGSIFRHFVREKICGAGTQIECFNVWNNLLNFYTFGRTAYDTSLTLKDNLDRLCRLYGNAGPVLSEIFGIYERTLDGEAPLNQGGVSFMKHVDKKRVYALFEEALDVAGTPVARNNVRLSRMAFRYTDLEVNDPLEAEKRDPVLVAAYADPTGELGYLAENFDSFTRNDPGYGITIPASNAAGAQIDSRWYAFE
ncbi:MAG: DUF4838 domain-containing protein [Eubacteriales bacterium]|nr:DUF4838 domain-containing protein [Eubacteriales bacterium]